MQFIKAFLREWLSSSAEGGSGLLYCSSPVVIEDDVHNYSTGDTRSVMVKEDKSWYSSGVGLILLSPGVL